LITEARLARLKAELKQRHPALTDAHLERIGIRWNETWSVNDDGTKGGRSVAILVIMEDRPGADASAVVETAARILDAEINGPVLSGIQPTGK
jgi:hypothetical protein